MASGMARGARERGRRIAFGDGRKIIWDANSEIVFRGNPNIAAPGSEGAKDLEWIGFYRGNRIYNRQGPHCWEWNLKFRPVPGEIFLSAAESAFGTSIGRGYVVIEPNLPGFKAASVNKRWPPERFDQVAMELKLAGYRVLQFLYAAGHRVPAAEQIKTKDFRYAMAVLAGAALYIGPEGGLHHGAAAVGIPAVVLFGGFVPPEVTGYPTHTNLTGGAMEACGSFRRCAHCQAAMEAIGVDDVLAAAHVHLKESAAA